MKVGVFAAAVLCVAGAAAQQPAAGAGAPNQAVTVAWSNSDIESIARQLQGSWKSSAPVPAMGATDGASAEIVLTLVPAVVEGVPDALYAEAARSDSLWAPYRQAVYQLYPYKGGVRLRTYEFVNRPLADAIVGLWAAPAKLPKIARDDLLATLDLDMKKSGAGWTGKTPYAYPTGVGGAVEMTSEMTITGDSLVVSDVGVSADGKAVWGSSEKITFSKFTPSVTSTTSDDGLTITTYDTTTEGPSAELNDRLTMHYSGWRPDGYVIDSSFDKGSPATMTLGSGLIPGWNNGLIGAKRGSIVRLAIPSALAWGERGSGWRIPPNTDVFFFIQVMSVEKPPKPATEQEAEKPAEGQPEAGAAGGGGASESNPK